MRKLASVLVCVVVAFTLLAIPASATDYGFDPEYAIEVTGAAVRAVDIKDAIEAGVPIALSEDNTLLSLNAISEIANADAPVEFILANGLNISIDPASITDNAQAINLNIDFAITSAGNQVAGIPANSIALFPSASGDFGFEINIHITADQLAQAGLKGNNVKLFYVSGDTIRDMGKARLNADGSVTVVIDSASHYILSDQDIAVVAAEVGLTVVEDAPARTDRNPITGVVLSFAGFAVAGTVALTAKKLKKK